MKKALYILLEAGILLQGATLKGQNVQSADTLASWVMADSLVYRTAASADTTLIGKNIFDLMPSAGENAVRVYQSEAVREGFDTHLSSNSTKTLSGYRVRIFFDNRQDARTQSENTLKRFTSSYPGITAYRSYTNPFFKVTVGDFRTRSEAIQLLKKLLPDFPSAFVVKENIGYPVADKDNSFTVDTVKVRKYILPR